MTVLERIDLQLSTLPKYLRYRAECLVDYHELPEFNVVKQGGFTIHNHKLPLDFNPPKDFETWYRSVYFCTECKGRLPEESVICSTNTCIRCHIEISRKEQGPPPITLLFSHEMIEEVEHRLKQFINNENN